MTTTATLPIVPAEPEILAVPASGVPVLDRVAMRVGLALLLWGRQRAAAPRTARPERPSLVRDARWYMR